jgi:voltage-gated potassium channel
MSSLKKNRTLRIALFFIGSLVLYFVLVSLLIYVEKGSTQSSLTNYSNAIWYSLVTLTTVGYGDIFPATVHGRLIGYIFILGSMAFYGVLIGQFTLLMTTIKENRKLGYSGTQFTDHALIIGWNDFSKMVVDQLMRVGKKVAILTNIKDDIDLILERYHDHSSRVYTLYTDFSNYEMLEKANILQASMVFVNHGSDTDKLVYILNVKKMYPDTDFVVTLDNGDLKHTFIHAGVINTVSKYEISSNLLASYIFEPDVASYSESIMSSGRNEAEYDIKQLLVTKSNPFIGQAYQDVFFELKKRYNTVLIGITKRDKFGARKLIKNPHGEIKIAPGDYLIMILSGKAYKLLSKIFKVEEGFLTEKTNVK